MEAWEPFLPFEVCKLCKEADDGRYTDRKIGNRIPPERGLQDGKQCESANLNRPDVQREAPWKQQFYDLLRKTKNEGCEGSRIRERRKRRIDTIEKILVLLGGNSG